MKTPKAVLISDIHYNINNLEVADAALRAAVNTANALSSRLIILGDLHDTKAFMRAECINRIGRTLGEANCKPWILIGNHDLVNEKGQEHALECFSSVAKIIDQPTCGGRLNAWFIPYQTNKEVLLDTLSKIPPKSLIFAHQGVAGAYMGEYTQDKTSVPAEAFKGHTVYSGHYHRHQILQTGDGGTFTYLGTPYTTSFAEANDGDKGFHILYDDHTTEFVRTNLRKHVVLERTAEQAFSPTLFLSPNDKLWLKITGPQSEIAKLSKKDLGNHYLGHDNFKLDLIPNTADAPNDTTAPPMTPSEGLIALIDNLKESAYHKQYLKHLVKELLGDNKRL